MHCRLPPVSLIPVDDEPQVPVSLIPVGLDAPPQSGSYRCIVVDPPWPTGPHPAPGKGRLGGSEDKRYSLMTLDDILDIPIGKWAGDDTFLWVWGTNSKLADGRPAMFHAMDLFHMWGFNYHTLLTWNKTNAGPCPFGPYRITTEHVVFGWRGKFKVEREHMGKFDTGFRAASVIGGHGTKPGVLYDHIVEHFPRPPVGRVRETVPTRLRRLGG